MMDRIKFNKARKRWELLRNGLVIAASHRLHVLKRRFPEAKVGAEE